MCNAVFKAPTQPISVRRKLSPECCPSHVSLVYLLPITFMFGVTDVLTSMEDSRKYMAIMAQLTTTYTNTWEIYTSIYWESKYTRHCIMKMCFIILWQVVTPIHWPWLTPLSSSPIGTNLLRANLLQTLLWQKRTNGSGFFIRNQVCSTTCRTLSR